MRLIITFFTFLLCSIKVVGQQKALKLSKINFYDLPKEIEQPNNTKAIYYWEDNNGKNYLVLTNLRQIGKGNLEVFHYTQNDSTIKLVKCLQESRRSEFMKKYEFLMNSIMLTDLNKNGIGEITLQYKSDCRTDISALYKELFFLENGKVSKLEGYMNLKLNNKIIEHGHYINDDDFKSGPAIILKHVKKEWAKYLNE